MYSSEEDFAVTAAGGLSVTVSAGVGWVHPARFEGYSVIMREAETLALALADGQRTRIDRIDIDWTEDDYRALCLVCPEADLTGQFVPREVRDRMPGPHDVPLPIEEK